MAIQRGGQELWNSSKMDRSSDPTLLGFNRYVKHRVANDYCCEIFIRLRHSKNHYKFRSYHEIDKIMCHELAHCEHQDHGIAFYKLMGDIQIEHSEIVENSAAETHQEETVEEKFGYNIYKSSKNGMTS